MFFLQPEKVGGGGCSDNPSQLFLRLEKNHFGVNRPFVKLCSKEARTEIKQHPIRGGLSRPHLAHKWEIHDCLALRSLRPTMGSVVLEQHSCGLRRKIQNVQELSWIRTTVGVESHFNKVWTFLYKIQFIKHFIGSYFKPGQFAFKTESYKLSVTSRWLTQRWTH